MIALIDTIFAPFLEWLIKIKTFIQMLSVPASRPLNISNYLGPFALLGPYWMTFITTAAFLGFVYIVVFLIVSTNGLSLKFKETIKWW